MFPVHFIEQDHFSSSLDLNDYMLHLVPSLFFKISFIISHGIAYILGMDDLAVKRHILSIPGRNDEERYSIYTGGFLWQPFSHQVWHTDFGVCRSACLVEAQ